MYVFGVRCSCSLFLFVVLVLGLRVVLARAIVPVLCTFTCYCPWSCVLFVVHCSRYCSWSCHVFLFLL